ncbi:hypothetical protein [Blastococcus sp. SYSU D00695]
MVPVLAVVGAALVAAATTVVLMVWGRLRYARRLPSFRCRVGSAGPPGSRRWSRRLTRAAWAGDVLLIRSGLLRLWLTPVPAGVAEDSTVRRLQPDEVRGLGLHPVVLRICGPDGRPWEVAVARQDADRLIGPFLTTALSGLPRAPRERGAP